MPSSVFNHTYVSPSTPIIMLSTKNHEVLGFINNFDKQSVNINFNMNSANEISFDIYREVDGVKEPLWDSIIDFKYIYVKQADEFGNKIYEEFYTIEVSIDDGDDTVKHITGTSACEFELSKRMLYGLEINTETDFKAQETNGEIPKGGDYISTKFYDSENPKYSLLHRVLNDHNAAINDYQIRYVSPSLCNIERKYTADGKDIYSFLTGDVAKETECLFAFNSVERGVYVYDLKFVCDSCGKRGEPAAVCPHCGSASYASVFGENTNLYISAENYAEQITRTGKTDNVFNCLRISGGDEIINTAIAYVNPNGTRYVYSFSEDMLNDMPVELKNKILAYNTLYQSKQAEYQQKSEAYYNAVDRKYELQHSMMPEVTTPTTTADEQASQLPGKFSDFGDVYVADITTISTTSANLAVQGMAAVLCDARYKATATGTITTYTTGTTYVTWTGTVKIENYGRSEDNAITSSFSVIVRDGSETSTGYANFLEQRILKKLDRDDSTFFDIFTIPYVEPGDATFKAELKKYGLASLKGFYQSYDTCLSVLTETGDSDPNKKFNSLVPKPYDVMYKPYHDRQVLVANEMRVRETELFGVGGTEELPTGGVQQTINNLNAEIKTIHDLLNFKNYIGDELYQVFSHYRMESSYSNSNYVSTGLDTPRLFENATALYEMGLTEVYKASQLQYTLNCTLNDLLLDKYEDTTLTSEDGALFFQRFTPYIDAFQLGNWLSLKSDEKIFYLRLLSISVDYGSLNNISVTFSEALQVNGIISDAQSILEQAKSMASSYDTVAHQATEGEDAQYRVEDWLQNGLDAALTTLKNSNSEDVVFDKNGIMSRSYDDITETYSPKQLRITSRVLAFTDDNWESAKLALGESLFSRYDEDNDQFISERGYGLLAEYLNGSYITGSQIVGGDIYSTNYSETNHTGSHIDLNTGYFSLAGGSIFYDGDHLSISIGGKSVGDAVDTVTIEYAKNTSPSTEPTSGWQPTQPARSEGEYLWQKTTITYLSDKAPEVTVVNITGIDGKDGEKGADGKGVKATTVSYAWWNSGTSAPLASSDRWRSTIVTNPDPTNYPYLWTKTIIVYTDNSNSTLYSVSKDGQDGKDGKAGKTGTGVSSVATQYAIRYSASSSSGYYVSWSDSTPEYDENCYNGGYYYWTRTKTYYDNSSTPSYGDPVVNYGLTTANQIAYEDRQGINDLNNTTVLKVQNPSSGAIAAVKLSASASGASTFQIGATSIKLTADETIDFLSGGTINMESKTISITSSNFSVTSNGKITAKLGTIGGWNITNNTIYSSASGGGGSGSYSVAGFGDYPWSQLSTISGYKLYASSNMGVNSSYSRCTITITGYETFVLKVLSNGEKNWDYVCVGNLDKSNISYLKSANTSTEIKWSFYNDDQEATSASDTRDYTKSSLYKEVKFEAIHGGTHTIEVIFYKDTSNNYGNDRGYFYVDEAQCVGYSSGASDSDFVLSTRDFERRIGDTSRNKLRMAVGNNFAISNNGTLYANGGIFRGEITATSGKVGGWDIGTNSLKSSSAYLQITASNDSNTYIRLQNTSNQARIIFSGTDAWIYARTNSDSNMVGMMNFQADNSTSGVIYIPASTRLELKYPSVLRVTSGNYSGNRLLAFNDGGVLTETALYVDRIGTVKDGTIDTTRSLASGTTNWVGYIYLDIGTWIVFAKAQMSANVGDTKVLQAGIGDSSSSTSLSESTSQGNKVNVVAIVTITSAKNIYLNMNQNSGSSYHASSESWIKAVRIK